MELQPYQQRVLDEYNELDDKLNKLYDFINGDVFLELSITEQVTLHLQSEYMFLYLNSLAKRLDIWGYWESCCVDEEEVPFL